MAIVIAGDPDVGKTKIQDCFAEMNNCFRPHNPGDDSYIIQWEENGQHYSFSFWENDRNTRYRGSYLILVFSVIDRDSFESISSFWVSKFPDFFSNGTCILVGNKCDCRSSDPGRSISSKMGADLMKEIVASIYIETSATTTENIAFIFSIIARNRISKSTPPSIIPFSDSLSVVQTSKTKKNYDNSVISSAIYQNFPLLQACYPTIYSPSVSSYYPNIYFYPYGYYS